MAFGISAGTAAKLVGVVDEGVAAGVNYNTDAIDERAWDMYETVCAAHHTDPLRTAQDVRDYPQRNMHLLAVLMLHASATCRPRKGVNG